MASRIQTIEEGTVQASSVHGGEPTSRHLELVGKVEGYDDSINMAFIIPREEGVICISDDRTIKVWMKRYTGQYWPSICQNVPGICISMDFCVESRRLVVGLDSGLIMEFKVGDDYNKMHHIQNYTVHTGRVNGVLLVESKKCLLSCGADRCIQVHCTESGRRKAMYQISASCTCIQFDAVSSYMFVGDSTGQITVLKLKDEKIDKVTILKRHTATVQCMTLDKTRRLLFSAGNDQSIIVWHLKDEDLRDSKAFELHGHLDKVRGLSYCERTNQLFSVGEDCCLVCWDIVKERNPVARWKESDICENCLAPFFWNVKSMWEMKTLGSRQHHCRNCGKALCTKCSTHSHIIPKTGFELQVRVCNQCHKELKEEEQISMATFHDIKHPAVCIHVDENGKTILTAGKDRIIKLWDASRVLGHSSTPVVSQKK